jgi:hypothetical protein
VTVVLDFEELRIRVRRIGAERYLVLANGQAHAIRATLIGDEAAALRKEASRLIEIELGHAPSGGTDVTTRLRRLGQSVFDLLFDDELSACLQAARSQAHQQDRGLRLRFDLPPELQGLPVEALRSPSERPEQTFALNANLSIARSLPGDPPGRRMPGAADEPDFIRLLVAIASPSVRGLPPIDATAELARLRELPELAVQTTVHEHATRRDIESWLAENDKHPAVVMLIAHGSYDQATDEGVVLLEAEDGTADPVPGHLLSGILVRAQLLRLVVLNLCHGAQTTAKEPFSGVAQALIGRGIPAVAAMNGLVTDRAANIFGPRLLDGICANRTLDEAMTAARQRIANLPGHTTIEWATPTLFLHNECGHSWLFKAREVRDDDESTDLLRAGAAELARLTLPGNVKPATVIAAARYLRLQRDWRRVERTAKAGKPAGEQALLVAEAGVEQAWPDIDRVCQALADEDPEKAQAHLDKIRNLLPQNLLRHLAREISDARAVSDLIGEARQAEAGQDWPAAVRWYEEARDSQPAGLLDVTAKMANARQSSYNKGRAAEAEHAWVDAATAYEPCGEFDDAPARLAYVRGRAAADAGEWAVAHQEFRVAESLGIAADEWSRYAAGRAAEKAGQWDSAHQFYTGLPKNLLDAGVRMRYAAGRSADDRADWDGVIDGFGELPDDFAQGEVGRRRRFARAKLAALRTDWRSVLALLGDVSDADREGSVGLVRKKAHGRLAEEEGDWAAATAIYAAVIEADAEFGRSHRYASGRVSELDENWSGALDEYAALPADYRDVTHRAGYAKARVVEQDQDWQGAVQLYAVLPDNFHDVTTRSVYAQLRHAVSEEDWDAAADTAATLGDYQDSGTLAAYARGRLAEHHEDWATATAEYELCSDYADSAQRQAYATGRQLDACGHWSAAIEAYDKALPDTDGRDRRDRLERLLAALPWVDGLASATLVADPVALRQSTFPYLALRAAGVTPASPTEIVKDAAYVLMERGGISWQERVAWDQLRTPAKRLLLDARLYQLSDPDALGRELNSLVPASEPALLARLCARLPEDAPLFTLLAGNRADSIAAWRRRLTENPDDLAGVHCLAVTSYWHAQELEDTGAWEQAAQVWRVALACWAALLTNDEFWIGWRQARAACYGHAVTPADTARLRAELGRYLLTLLTGHEERHASAGRPREADRYQELIYFLEAELDAAQCLKEAGGLPLADDTAGRLVCGPEYLRLVGLTGQFGEFVAFADPPALGDTQSRGAVVRQLRCLFSTLSTASSFLEHHRFESALRTLPEYHRQRRAELPADCAGPAAPGHPEPADCPQCQEFLARDPAYTYLPNRWFRLLQDAVGIAVRARLSIARDLLTSRQPDRAMTELGGAIAVSANALMGVRTRQAVLRMILGRVDALTERDLWDINRMDEAIALVEMSVPVVGAPGRQTLIQKWADLLVNRGVWYGSACQDYGLRPDVTRALAELRKAFELNPDSAWVQYNLAQGLIYRAEELPERHVAGRLTVLVEALGIVHSGLNATGSSNRLRDALDNVLKAVQIPLMAELSVAELNKLIETYAHDAKAGVDARERARELVKEAERRRAAGDLTGCARLLVRATRADPQNDGIRMALLAAIEAELARLREEKRRGQ